MWWNPYFQSERRKTKGIEACKEKCQKTLGEIALEQLGHEYENKTKDNWDDNPRDEREISVPRGTLKSEGNK